MSKTIATPHVCCGCGGVCDSSEVCPMAYNCMCGFKGSYVVQFWAAREARAAREGAQTEPVK